MFDYEIPTNYTKEMIAKSDLKFEIHLNDLKLGRIKK